MSFVFEVENVDKVFMGVLNCAMLEINGKGVVNKDVRIGELVVINWTPVPFTCIAD